MSDERIYLPGWVKPTAALAIALLGAGATAGWVGANYAGNTNDQIREIRDDIRDTQREVCAIRVALDVKGTTVICRDGNRLLALSSFATLVPPDSVDSAVSGTALVTILAGLAMGLFLLGGLGFFLCWFEILRLRPIKHELRNLLHLFGGVLDTIDHLPGGVGRTVDHRAELDRITVRLFGAKSRETP